LDNGRDEFPRSVLLAGGSGLVGRELLAQLLAEESTTVHVLLRREVPDLPVSRHLKRHVIDFAQPGPLPTADTVYIALGTTLKTAGSKAAFRAVDLDAVVAVARAARQAGVERAAVVSAMGADIGSHVFYSRVKGEMEAQLAALGFARLVLARPSLLAGGRARLGQPRRWGEQLALMLFEPLGGLMPARVRPIDAAVVARAMRMAVRRDGPAVQIIESAELHTLGGTP
jgi:uncharacterized protein YbjT (DUF2867 family)